MVFKDIYKKLNGKSYDGLAFTGDILPYILSHSAKNLNSSKNIKIDKMYIPSYLGSTKSKKISTKTNSKLESLSTTSIMILCDNLLIRTITKPHKKTNWQTQSSQTRKLIRIPQTIRPKQIPTILKNKLLKSAMDSHPPANPISNHYSNKVPFTPFLNSKNLNPVLSIKFLTFLEEQIKTFSKTTMKKSMIPSCIKNTKRNSWTMVKQSKNKCLSTINNKLTIFCLRLFQITPNQKN